MSSIAYVNGLMLQCVYADFRDQYVTDTRALFKAEAVDQLYRQALERHGHGREQDLLMSIMAISIFERMLRTRMSEVDVQHMQPPSPLSEVQSFSGRRWPTPPQLGAATWWTLTRDVKLASDVDILEPISTGGPARSMVILKDKKYLTAIDRDEKTAWGHELLSLWPSEMPLLTVDNLVQRVDKDHATVADLLARLFRAGVLVADTAGVVEEPRPGNRQETTLPV
ncbi:MAG: hypothetical protein ACI9DC_000823 [Gammaproteobacteria bacterium]|jgi:hypothetical protein